MSRLAWTLLAAAAAIGEAYVPLAAPGRAPSRGLEERVVQTEAEAEVRTPWTTGAVASAFGVGSLLGYVSRRKWLAGAASAALVLPSQARATGRSQERTELTKVDINNASVKEYQQFKGLYPTGAAIISGSGPYRSVEDVYKLPGIADNDIMKAIVKKYEPYLECQAYDPARAKETRILYKQQ
mmetsp:Transcript_39198/g.73090  ORF Transcript_39198/g.73090 Transcript_39198/m.73090 type:complete len:183 (+) Transcript_39198:86-634(+)